MTQPVQTPVFSPAERWGWVAAGGALMLLGLRTRPLPGLLLGLGGAWLLHASLTGRRPLTLPSSSGPQAVNLDQQVHVAAPLPKVYAFWRDFSHLPGLLPGLQSVQNPQGPVSRWTPTTGPAVEVDITELHPERVIAWRSRSGAAWAITGRVTLRAAPGGGTDLRVQLRYPVAGAGSGWPFGRSVQQQLVQRLQRLDQQLG